VQRSPTVASNTGSLATLNDRLKTLFVQLLLFEPLMATNYIQYLDDGLTQHSTLLKLHITRINCDASPDPILGLCPTMTPMQ
jgi:hypothetical protein